MRKSCQPRVARGAAAGQESGSPHPVTPEHMRPAWFSQYRDSAVPTSTPERGPEFAGTGGTAPATLAAPDKDSFSDRPAESGGRWRPLATPHWRPLRCREHTRTSGSAPARVPQLDPRSTGDPHATAPGRGAGSPGLAPHHWSAESLVTCTPVSHPAQGAVGDTSAPSR